MSHPAQNWKCKCGRGPSIDHSVGGYCLGAVIIESLEEELASLKSQLAKEQQGYRGASADRDLWKSKAEKLAGLVMKHIAFKFTDPQGNFTELITLSQEISK